MLLAHTPALLPAAFRVTADPCDRRAAHADESDLQSAPESLLAAATASTGTFLLPNTELRPGIDYLLEPGAEIAFGSLDSEIKVAVEYEATSGGDGGSTKMLMDLMASGMGGSAQATVQKGTASDT